MVFHNSYTITFTFYRKKDIKTVRVAIRLFLHSFTPLVPYPDDFTASNWQGKGD